MPDAYLDRSDPQSLEAVDPDAGLTGVAAEPWARPWPEPALPRALPRTLPRATLTGPLDRLLDRLRAAPLVFPIVVAILSRLYSSVLLSLVPYFQSESAVPRLSGYRDTFLQWDGQWYLMIANTGYHAGPMQAGPFGGRHDFAFFPAWPTVLRAFHAVGIQPADVAVPLANLLFVVAAVVMYGVLARHFGPTAARWGIVLLAFSPSAYVLSLAYSEPLFLLLAAASFATRDGRLRPILAASAMLTRVAGIGLAVGAAATWLRNWRDWPAFLTAAAVTASFAAWWIFIGFLTGDPAGWLQGSPKWSHDLGIPAIADAISTFNKPRLGDIAFVGTMLGASILVLRRHLELGIFSVAAIGLSIVGAPVDSMQRHALAAFPAFALLADRLGPRWSLVLAIGFALLQANYVWLAFVGGRPLAP